MALFGFEWFHSNNFSSGSINWSHPNWTLSLTLHFANLWPQVVRGGWQSGLKFMGGLVWKEEEKMLPRRLSLACNCLPILLFPWPLSMSCHLPFHTQDGIPSLYFIPPFCPLLKLFLNRFHECMITKGWASWCPKKRPVCLIANFVT